MNLTFTSLILSRFVWKCNPPLIVTCSGKITRGGWLVSIKIRKEKPADEEEVYGGADRRDIARG